MQRAAAPRRLPAAASPSAAPAGCCRPQRRRRLAVDSESASPWWHQPAAPCGCARTSKPRAAGAAAAAAGAAGAGEPQRAGAAAAARREPPPRIVEAAPGGWAYAAPAGAPPLVLVVDGTNLAARCARPPPWDARPPPQRFAWWLRFLLAATGAAAGLVCFDNKGSTGGNARAALDPAYNRARHGKLPAGEYYEADDAMADAAQWLAGRPGPPTALLVSADSDLAQAMGPACWWLETEEAPGPARPSALRLHGAAAFEAAAGYPPARHAAFLALTGKAAAGVKGTGLSARAARGLVERYGGLEEILAAADAGALTALGPRAAAALGPGAGRAAARRNLRLLTLGCGGARLLPAAVEAELLEALRRGGRVGAAAAAAAAAEAPAPAAAEAPAKIAAGASRVAAAMARAQPAAAAAPAAAASEVATAAAPAAAAPAAAAPAAAPAAAAAAAGLRALVALHPVVGARWEARRLELAALSAVLSRLGLPHAVAWVCPRRGLPLDAAVRVRGADGRPLVGGGGAAGQQLGREAIGGGGGGGGGSSNSGGSGGGDGGSTDGPPAGQPLEAATAEAAGEFDPGSCLALVLVGPEDLAAAAPAAADAGQEGIVQVKPQALSPAAKRRLSLVKGCGWRPVLVSCGGAGGDEGARAAQLGAVLTAAM
ncbi:hypothetical protein Rsub_12878 [Raphidocelis subcapitata]|uniref:5'-3' exonuclease domain-containing protein n=1 Tax=Raphidocelis subcapitata TaxID=307507 RepID=A0A2V0PPX5_9CHLO|nr:hypothetical protein Rsub_12878 [Raphidocelis subcapitata]|eukprot:GBG00234.1 hypothetical protein Rsub_12878 [Raphidocelis subcapitata]